MTYRKITPDPSDAPDESIRERLVLEKLASRHVTDVDWDDFSGRGDPEQRFRIYCRAHDGTLTLIATCGSEAAVGVTICTLGREGMFDDCALGVLDELGEKGQRWILRPWEASAKNASDAGRVLARSKKARP